jgi:Protein of unknown function (DUF2778)
MWTYQISTGKILDPSSQLQGIGYSGNGTSLNNPLDTRIAGHGPVPVGMYIMGPWYDDAPGPESKGPIVARLTPYQDNEMFGRSGFMIHGDNEKGNHSASDGCIVAGHDYRAALAGSRDNVLEVIA